VYIKKIPKYVVKCNSCIVNNLLVHHIHLLLGAFSYFIDLEVACWIIYAIKTLSAIGVFFRFTLLICIGIRFFKLTLVALGIGLLPFCLWFSKAHMVLASFIISTSNFSFLVWKKMLTILTWCTLVFFNTYVVCFKSFHVVKITTIFFFCNFHM